MPKCPTCGQDTTPSSVVKPWNNNMCTYVLPNGKVYGIMNNDAEKVEVPANDVKGTPAFTLIREDVYLNSQRQKSVSQSAGSGQSQVTGSGQTPTGVTSSVPKSPAPPTPPKEGAV